MRKTLKIVVADDDRLVLRTLRRYVEDLGHRIVAEACSGAELIEAVYEFHPDVVITDINLEGIDGLSAIDKFSKQHQSAIIVISGSDDEFTLERASQHPIQAFLPKPITSSSLLAAIVVATRRFAEVRKLQSEVDCTKRRLAERALIEKAKGMLMKRTQIDEDLAYKELRLMARNSGQTIGQVAQGLLLSKETTMNLDSRTKVAARQ